jgi:hypothetical protein
MRRKRPTGLMRVLVALNQWVGPFVPKAETRRSARVKKGRGDAKVDLDEVIRLLIGQVTTILAKLGDEFKKAE